MKVLVFNMLRTLLHEFENTGDIGRDMCSHEGTPLERMERGGDLKDKAKSWTRWGGVNTGRINIRILYGNDKCAL